MVCCLYPRGRALLIGQVCLVVRVRECHRWYGLIDKRFGFCFHLFCLGDTIHVLSNIDSHQEYCGPVILWSTKMEHIFHSGGSAEYLHQVEVGVPSGVLVACVAI